MNSQQKFRQSQGGLIDRSRPLNFTFNNQSYQGYYGDTLASALLANGVRVISRSFKFHRPRGVFSSGVEEPNALLKVDYGSGTMPLASATTLPLVDNLSAKSENCFPSVNFDLGRFLDYTRPLWPAGFYNKTFKWPSWHTYEWAFRKTAGLTRLPDDQDQTQYRQMNRHCDLLIVGMGQAGLNAAIQAADQGRDVLIVEKDVLPGGSLLFDEMEIDGQASRDWITGIFQELTDRENVQLLLSSTAVGYYDHNVITVHDCSAKYRSKNALETFWKVRADQVILATGAIEQPLIFANNDLPGIMLAGAMREYHQRYAVKCGTTVVGVANNDFGWRSMFSLKEAGIKVPLIIDSRTDVDEGLSAKADEHGIEVQLGSVPLKAKGSRCVKLLEYLTSKQDKKDVKCDAIAVSGGLNPTAHLYSQAGGKLRFDNELACFVPDHCRQNVSVVGAANGEFTGLGDCNVSTRQPAPMSKNSQWVDLLHDVTVSDIELAVQENYVSVEHMKRYTTTGMAVDQGKTSNLNALSLLASSLSKSPGEVGTTTYRPNFIPVTMGAISGNRKGELYIPTRHLSAHNWHHDRGAVFDDYGGWRRPAYYGKERDSSILKEVDLVRHAVGLFDASPLGKIEVKGPDAGKFLNRIYVNNIQSLKVGAIRYGLMLNENAIVIDDGVCVRLEEDHYLLHTTSSNAERIVSWLEEWHQCEWPHLNLVICPVTTQWAVLNVAGPGSRETLQGLEGMVDLSSMNLPHMGFQSASFKSGLPYRIQRVSFTGELSYELAIPAKAATEYFSLIMDLGEPLGIGLFGIEALLNLRIEKGFFHVGVDTDGTTNPYDLGFETIVQNQQDDFIGARSLKRSADCDQDRRQFVGLKIDGNGSGVKAGAHLVTNNKNPISEGFLTSAWQSPIVGCTIGLGTINGGLQRMGEKIFIYDDKKISTATIVDRCFYDPKGGRMHE